MVMRIHRSLLLSNRCMLKKLNARFNKGKKVQILRIIFGIQFPMKKRSILLLCKSNPNLLYLLLIIGIRNMYILVSDMHFSLYKVQLQ